MAATTKRRPPIRSTRFGGLRFVAAAGLPSATRVRKEIRIRTSTARRPPTLNLLDGSPPADHTRLKVSPRWSLLTFPDPLRPCASDFANLRCRRLNPTTLLAADMPMPALARQVQFRQVTEKLRAVEKERT